METVITANNMPEFSHHLRCLVQLMSSKNIKLDYEKLAPLDPERPDLPADVREQVNIEIKYEGYIRRQRQQVEHFKKLESRLIPEDIDYDEVGSLRIEALQKLKRFRPHSLGQAGRIAGVSPADVAMLNVYLEQKRRENK